MNSGGDVLKLFFSLSAILLTSSLLLLFSNSFTNAEINNDTTLSVVSEDSALIAVVDWDGRTFSIKNNTEETIEITSIELGRGSGMDITENQVPSIIGPGGLSQVILIGDAEELSGRDIQLVARWSGGNAEIISTIPEFVEDEVEIVPVLEIEETDSVTEDIETDSVTEDIETDSVSEDIETDSVSEDIETDSVSEDIKTDTATENIITDTAPENMTTNPVPEDQADPVAEETTDSDSETNLESDEN